LRLFVSCCGDDADFVARLDNDLSVYQLEVWWYKKSVRPGESIPQAIEAALSNADAVLLLLSNAAVESRWVREELDSTLFSCIRSGRPMLIPILLEDCNVPNVLRHRQLLDFTVARRDSDSPEYERQLRTLLSTIYKNAGEFAAPGAFIPGYKDISILGEGGFSTVYKATDVRTDEVKAIKVPKGDGTLNSEIAVLRLLEGHPGIVPLETVIAVGERTAMVMPYVGHSLKWHIKHKQITPANVRLILDLMRSVFETLSFAHSRNILHGDIKPSNIVTTIENEPRILDFGMAQKIYRADFKQSTVVRGTLCYMSPEQQQAFPPSKASDIYSCGAVFYELLTGEKPVGRFRNPRFHNRDIPPALERIVERCLELAPADRYQSADEAIAELSRIKFSPSGALLIQQIIGSSPATRKLQEEVVFGARLYAPVLITGDPGTGKTIVGHQLYREYCRFRGEELRFIVVDCTRELAPQMPFVETFKEVTRHPKRLQQFDRGVIFLDNIERVSSEDQERIARIIEAGELGKIEVKVIAASSIEAGLLASDRRFDRYVFDRLDVIHIKVPRLCERMPDIPELVDHLIPSIARELGIKRRFHVTAEALMKLQWHHWPGNVRELRNVLMRALIASEGNDGILTDFKVELHDEFRREPMSLAEVRKTAERAYIERLLTISKADLSLCAGWLKIEIDDLLQLIFDHNLEEVLLRNRSTRSSKRARK
jgi:DNA-binding NtrC family response regulator